MVKRFLQERWKIPFGYPLRAVAVCGTGNSQGVPSSGLDLQLHPAFGGHCGYTCPVSGVAGLEPKITPKGSDGACYFNPKGLFSSRKRRLEGAACTE